MLKLRISQLLPAVRRIVGRPISWAICALALAVVLAVPGQMNRAAAQGSSSPATRVARTLQSAFAADRAFAAAVAKDGPSAAFRAWYAPDGQFLDQGEVTRGNRAISSGFGDFKLEWKPDGGHGSASGDLAVTTGRYSIISGGSIVETGRYLTVWSHTAASGWKVVMGSKDVDVAMLARSAEAAEKKR